MARRNSIDDLWRYVDMKGPDDCWPWLGSWGGRRTHLMPYFSASGQRWIAYRKVYELTHGVDLLASQLMCHSCDKGSYPVGCCNPAHVRIGSPQDNVDDAKTRQRFGLPHSVVRNIKKLLERGHTQQNVADTYGCSRETISAIATGRTYGYIKTAEEAEFEDEHFIHPQGKGTTAT